MHLHYNRNACELKYDLLLLAWHSSNAFHMINEVTLHWAELVL